MDQTNRKAITSSTAADRVYGLKNIDGVQEEEKGGKERGQRYAHYLIYENTASEKYLAN